MNIKEELLKIHQKIAVDCAHSKRQQESQEAGGCNTGRSFYSGHILALQQCDTLINGLISQIEREEWTNFNE